MKAVTLKNIPDDILAQVKQLASFHHRSLNHEIIWCLQLYAKSNIGRSSESIIAQARTIRNSINGEINSDEINKFKNVGRSK